MSLSRSPYFVRIATVFCVRNSLILSPTDALGRLRATNHEVGPSVAPVAAPTPHITSEDRLLRVSILAAGGDALHLSMASSAIEERISYGIFESYGKFFSAGDQSCA